MALFSVFDIAGSAMSAQSVRLNATASNLANANNVASDPQSAYRGKMPVFESLMLGEDGMYGVAVNQVVENSTEAPRVHQPGHPMADDEGYVYLSNVNVMDEMVNMISASRAYQNSVEVLNTSKQLLLRTLTVGQ